MSTQIIAVHAVKQAGKDTALGFMQQWCEAHDLPMVTRGFADELKVSIIMILFGVEVSPEVANDFFDRYKEDNNATVKLSTLAAITSPAGGGDCHVKTPCLLHTSPNDMAIADATVRDLLTRMGTDVARDRWDKDFWVDRLLPLGAKRPTISFTQPNDKWLDSFTLTDVELSDPSVSIQARVGGIRDLRFSNELHRIKWLHGYTIKIRRDVAEERVVEDARAAGRLIHESDLLMDDSEFDAVFDNNGSLDDLAAQVDDFMDRNVRATL